VRYFKEKLKQEASQAFDNAEYSKALFIYKSVLNNLWQLPLEARDSSDFINAQIYVESKLTAIHISNLAQVPIKADILYILNENWEKIRARMVMLRKKAINHLASQNFLDETWKIIVEKCDIISDQLNKFYSSDGKISLERLSFLNAAYEWKLRAIQLGNNFDSPIEPKLHLDLLRLRELQRKVLYTRGADIAENIHNHIIAYNLLNIIPKENKLELFCYYLRATPNISSTELENIKAEGEVIISEFKEPRTITQEFLSEIAAIEQALSKVPTPQNIEHIILNQASKDKSILTTSKGNSHSFSNNISFALFPTIKKVSKKGIAAPVNPQELFTRFIKMIEALAIYGTKECASLFLNQCGEFFNESTLTPYLVTIEENDLFSITNEFYLAANQCATLAEEECLALFLTTVTSNLIALKPFLNKPEREEMILNLFYYLVQAVQYSDLLDGENENILGRMYERINTNYVVQIEEEDRFSPGYY
jgi:hypothetical protein